MGRKTGKGQKARGELRNGGRKDAEKEARPGEDRELSPAQAENHSHLAQDKPTSQASAHARTPGGERDDRKWEATTPLGRATDCCPTPRKQPAGESERGHKGSLPTGEHERTRAQRASKREPSGRENSKAEQQTRRREEKAAHAHRRERSRVQTEKRPNTHTKGGGEQGGPRHTTTKLN